MKYGISEKSLEQICLVFNRYPAVRKAVLYGSRAKGTYKNGSDIDLVIDGKDIDMQTFRQILRDLDDLMLPYTIDISVYSQIDNDDLIDHIKRVGKVIYTV